MIVNGCLYVKCYYYTEKNKLSYAARFGYVIFFIEIYVVQKEVSKLTICQNRNAICIDTYVIKSYKRVYVRYVAILVYAEQNSYFYIIHTYYYVAYHSSSLCVLLNTPYCSKRYECP